jgi:hypothetical protein
MKYQSILTTIVSGVLVLPGFGQAPVGDVIPETLGFTQAAPSFPLSDTSEFDFNDREGEVIVAVYHASW